MKETIEAAIELRRRGVRVAPAGFVWSNEVHKALPTMRRSAIALLGRRKLGGRYAYDPRDVLSAVKRSEISWSR